MKIFCQYIRWGYLAHSEDGQHRSGETRTGLPADAARLVADKAFGEGNYTLKRLASKLYEATPLPSPSIPKPQRGGLIPAQGNALGSTPPNHPSPEGAIHNP